MPNDEIYQKLLRRAFNLLAIRPRSEAEIKRRLKRFIKDRKNSQIILHKVVDRLKELKLIDDRAFVQWWIDSRKKVRPKGKKTIRQELLLKGVSAKLIDEELTSRYPREEEYQKASQLLSKKVSHYRNLPAKQLFQRMSRYLLQRGFSAEIVSEVIDEQLKKA